MTADIDYFHGKSDATKKPMTRDYLLLRSFSRHIAIEFVS